MRINVYADEITGDRFEVVEDSNRDGKFTGLRFNLNPTGTVSGKGKIEPDNAVTLWGRGNGEQLIDTLERSIDALKAGTKGAAQQSRREPATV